MRNPYRENVWLNGVALGSVDASIVVRPAVEPDVKNNITYISNAGKSGRRLTSMLRESKIIRVRFSIKGLYNLEERTRVVNDVNGWASAGGVMQISQRLGQQINVTCIKYVTPDENMILSDVYELEFEANVCPYWEKSDQIVLSPITDDEASGEISIPGTAPTFIEIAVTPTSSTLTSLVVTATSALGTSTISLSGLSVASGTTLTIGHDAHGFLTISAGGVSLLDKRSAASSDDLFVSPGTVAVSFTANTEVEAIIKARGRWL